MAELKVTTLTGTSTAGSIAVTGEGNSTTTNLQQGLAKCWLQSSDSAGITDSLNIASGTDNGTGDYTFAISNDMANSTYSIVSTASQSSGNSPVISCNPTNDTNSTSVYRLQVGLTTNGSGGAYTDIDKLNYSAVFGDLA